MLVTCGTDIIIKVDLIPEIASYIVVEAIARRSNTSLLDSTLTVSPSETTEVLIRVRAKESSRLPAEFISGKTSFDSVLLM
jgi:hypothetical protein